MNKTYGVKRAKAVFYASINKGRLQGTHPEGSKWEVRANKGRRRHGINATKISANHRRKISKGLIRYHKSGLAKLKK